MTGLEYTTHDTAQGTGTYHSGLLAVSTDKVHRLAPFKLPVPVFKATLPGIDGVMVCRHGRTPGLEMPVIFLKKARHDCLVTGPGSNDHHVIDSHFVAKTHCSSRITKAKFATLSIALLLYSAYQESPASYQSRVLDSKREQQQR